MRVVNRPSGGDHWTTQVECHGCKATLEIEETDLKTRSGELSSVEIFVNCPDCHAYIDPDKKIPYSMRSKLIDRHRNRRHE